MVVSATVTVAVAQAPIRLCKVVHGDDHQIVVGGRLVSEVRAGKTVPHPDLPAYTPADFPADIPSFIDDEPDTRCVQVFVMKRFSGMCPLRPVRACSLLFNPHDADAVRAWIKQEAET